jgi:DNA-binding winged helix-turn-helix (wHTH) protein
MRTPEKCSYLFGKFRLSVAEEKLYAEGRLVPISAVTIRILLVLVENRGEYLDKTGLMASINLSPDADPNTIQQAIHELRVALHDHKDSSIFIKTARGVGYKFVAEVTKVQDADLAKKLSEETAAQAGEAGQTTGSEAGNPGAEENISEQIKGAETSPLMDESVATELLSDGMNTFEEWIQGPGKGITSALFVCVLVTCAISVMFSLLGHNSAKPFATMAHFLVVLIIYIHFHPLKIRRDFLPAKEGVEDTFKKIIGCDSLNECNKVADAAKSALKRYIKYWKGLMLSWLSLYLCLTIIGFTGADAGNLEAGGDLSKQILRVTLSTATTLFNNWNTLMIFLCFYVLNKQIKEEEAATPELLDSLLTGPFLLLAMTAFEILLLLPIDKTAIPKAANMISGLAGGVTMALLVGRLQSKFMGPRLWLVIALYSYTAIQPLYIYLDQNRLGAVLLIDFALLLKCLLYIYVAWLLQSGRLLFYLARVKSAYQRVNSEWLVFRTFLK